MALIPSMVLKQLYTFGSLRNSADGVRFSLKNRLSDATVTALNGVSFDGQPVPVSKLSLVLDTGEILLPADLKATPIDFPLRKTLDIVADIEPLADGKHRIEVKFDAQPFGGLTLKVDGSIVKEEEKRIKIPRDNADNYSPEIIKARQQFIE
ncbi:MAG: hydroxymethylglutaryl-CoA reductase, partial [Armatimonadetes bacterium]|nr:hydroxymethylglutaryl-CoA reductase [Armatimonadota bacterium]